MDKNLEENIYILILYVCCTFTGNNKLLVVHRQNPCTPLHGLQSLTAADVLHRDTSLIRRRFSSQSSVGAAPGPAPSPTATIIPANGSSDPSTLPGVLDYSVHISYGTPEQQFPVFLDTSIDASLPGATRAPHVPMTVVQRSTRLGPQRC